MSEIPAPADNRYTLLRRGHELMAANMLAALKLARPVCEDAYEDARAYEQTAEGEMHPAEAAQSTVGAYNALSSVKPAIAAAEGVGIRAQSFAERERDLLEANNAMEERARKAERITKFLEERMRESAEAYTAQFIRMGRRIRRQREALQAVTAIAEEKLADMVTFDTAAQQHGRDYDPIRTAEFAATISAAKGL